MIDPSLAPAGKHCLHAYTPATEPYELWAGLDRRSPEYAQLKEQRSAVLWEGAWRKGAAQASRVPPLTCSDPHCCSRHCLHCPRRAAVRRIIPDIDERLEVTLVGTPLTHERFLRRHRGTYGPAIRAGEGLFPWPAVPGLPGLFNTGDFAFPGIGLPAVAASGAVTANSLVSVGQHMALLDDLGI